jgi:hypothetical protein
MSLSSRRKGNEMTVNELINALQVNIDNYKVIINDPNSDADHVERLKRVVIGYEADIRELKGE